MIEAIIAKKDWKFILNNAPSLSLQVKTKPSKLTSSTVSFVFETEKEYDDFESGFNFTIVHDGMNNQDTVNGIGLRLYEIYDNMEVYED